MKIRDHTRDVGGYVRRKKDGFASDSWVGAKNDETIIYYLKGGKEGFIFI